MPHLLMSLAWLCPALQPIQADIEFGTWARNDRHDGYVLGDGKMYTVVGLGRALTRSGKSQLTDEPAGLTRIAWVVGPHYTVGNLGFGWEIHPTIDGEPEPWTKETIRNPSEASPFWGVSSQNPSVSSEVTDMILPGESVMLRRVTISRPEGAPAARVVIDVPVFADPRNGKYCMYNGEEVLEDMLDTYRDRCGEHLKPRASVPQNKLQQIDSDAGTILHLGAPRALWQEISTRVPNDTLYATLFPERAMATAVTTVNPDVQVSVDKTGFHIDLGRMEGGAHEALGIWIATGVATDGSAADAARNRLAEWRNRDLNDVIDGNIRQRPRRLIRAHDEGGKRLIQVVDACADLITATQCHAGGVMAQPYMYPMYYVRDQYGSFRMLLSLGEHERALKVLQFYVAMQNREGIQNAHDCRTEPPDPTEWDPSAGLKDGRWSAAEVPSYIVLMARDYLRWTNDLARVAPLYDRLAYNVRIQKVNGNHLLPWAHDESYTNSKETRPKYEEEMTDSNLLYIGATRFMASLAATLGKTEDATEFEGLHVRTEEALMSRLWLEDEAYFVYARDASDDTSAMDKRPALDSLLRWVHLGLGEADDSIARGCFRAVTDHLVNPVRVVPEVVSFTTGMDPGYALHVASKMQHPSMHAAARALLSYASDAGLFSEYYSHDLETNTLLPFSGTLRPWESAVCGQAVLQYLVGLNVELDKGRISVQPHLPRDWTGWTTKEIELFGEGTLELSLKRAEDELELTVTRRGGVNVLEFDVEFGGFEVAPEPLFEGAGTEEGRPGVLTSSFSLGATASTEDESRRSLRIKIH